MFIVSNENDCWFVKRNDYIIQKGEKTLTSIVNGTDGIYTRFGIKWVFMPFMNNGIEIQEIKTTDCVIRWKC